MMGKAQTAAAMAHDSEAAHYRGKENNAGGIPGNVCGLQADEKYKYIVATFAFVPSFPSALQSLQIGASLKAKNRLSSQSSQKARCSGFSEGNPERMTGLVYLLAVRQGFKNSSKS